MSFTLGRCRACGGAVGAIVLIGALFAGCAQETTLFPTTEPLDTGGTGGQVQRFAVDVQVVTAEDDEPGAALGWGAGVPGAIVVLTRGDGHADSALADQAGRARFTRLIEGNYQASALRILSAGERGGTGVPDAYALGGGGSGGHLARDTALRVSLRSGRRGSVTLTEIRQYGPVYPGIGSYQFGFYFEIYNNADTTVYLDSLILGYPYFQYQDALYNPCSAYESWVDPEGLWTDYAFQVPGTGRDHPMAPGAVVVIATDAIDHGAVIPGEPDLSGAQFEFVGAADVDNPTAANMITLGRHFTLHGHGFFGWRNATAVFVARPLALDTLPVKGGPFGTTDHQYWRVPRGALLDVASYVFSPVNPSAPRCPSMVAPEIDAGLLQFGAEPDIAHPRSMQRWVLTTLPGGQVLMQRTGTSARDFRMAPPSPFVVR